MAFIATGETVVHALLAAGSLAELGVECRVLSMHTVKPLDTNAVIDAGRECRRDRHRRRTFGARRTWRSVCRRADASRRGGAFADRRISRRRHGHRQPGRHLSPLRNHHGRSDADRVGNAKAFAVFACRAFIVCPGPSAMTHIVAIDQSTSATKAVLFDAAGRVVDRAAREHRQIYPQAGLGGARRRRDLAKCARRCFVSWRVETLRQVAAAVALSDYQSA